MAAGSAALTAPWTFTIRMPTQSRQLALPPCCCSSRSSGRRLSVQGLYQRSRLSRADTVVELVEAREWATDHLTAASLSSSSCQEHSSSFQRAKTEQELLLAIDGEVSCGRLPPNAAEGMRELYRNYRDAVLQSGAESAEETVLRIMSTVLDRILVQFEDPFTFPPYHRSVREPFDYYQFGQDYIRPLLQFSNSYLGNKAHFDDIEDFLKQGHNVVLLSNHQSEADPAVIALLLQTTHPYLAETMTYIAGDRVVLDPFCKPFSLGRNLICVHSKKHINDQPELVGMKRQANSRALKELALLLRKGSQLIWIAPSGGRDRPSQLLWYPALFDPSTVDNMRRLLRRSGVCGHMYPMALLSYNIMPPPPQVQKELGEKRLVGYHGVGLSVGARLELETEVNAWKLVIDQYEVLHAAVHEGAGTAASTPSCLLSQPWMSS